MQFFTIPNIIPVNTVMNATINSSPLNLIRTINFAIQIVFTGTPTGSFQLQASCDPGAASAATFQQTTVNNPVNWTNIGSSTSVNAAGSVIWNIVDVGYNWVRVVYTDSSGGSATSTITVSTFSGKNI